ncbi:MAG TPA: DUF6113 family protein [Streptomyces sp.]|nr:DUF6113 family protein [Streptomyces sp.]
MNVRRIAGYAGLLVLGAVVGVLGVLVQSAWFPGGLVLALAGAAGLFWGGAALMSRKSGAAVPAVGWLVFVVLASLPRAEGDFLFGAGIGAYVFLFGGMFLAVLCATLALPVVPPTANRPR